MDGPDVCVVIPAYRAAATLPRAIESVLAQTRPAKQIVVVDDGSPEDLTPLRVRFGDAVQWERQPNRGAAAARNRGVELARTPLVAFLDADDYWEPAKLERQTALYARYPDLGLCCSAYFEQTPSAARRPVEVTIRDHPRFDALCRHMNRDAFEAGCCVWTGTVMAPRRLLREHRFESGLEPAEDRDLWIRLVRSAPSIHLSDRLATAVLEPDSLSRTRIDRDCQNMLRIIDRSRAMLGPAGHRFWTCRVLRRWAAEYLGQGQPQLAMKPATRRLSLQPWSPEAWWIAGKSLALAVRHPRPASCESLPARHGRQFAGKPTKSDRIADEPHRAELS